MIKTLMVVCGTGIATSTVVSGKIKEYLEAEGLLNSVKLLQSKISDEVSAIENGDYDIVVSTTLVPNDIKDKVISGLPLLTGVGKEKVLAEIKAQIEG